MLKNRLARARTHLRESRLDALIVTNMCNIRYLSGFTGSDGVAVVTADEAFFWAIRAMSPKPPGRLPILGSVNTGERLKGSPGSSGDRGWLRAGFESEDVTFSFHRNLAAGLPGVELVPVGESISALRTVKDVEELAMLRRTALAASSAFLETVSTIAPGRTEAEVAFDLEWRMRSAGIDGKSFDFIVASGERGALPHGKASTKVICRGELVTIDFGGILDGFCSDETVTVAVGSPTEKAREIYGIVKEAQDRAIAAVRPGVPVAEIDGVARSFIEERGYGRYFGHGLGHGVGLEVHEKPVVSPRGTAVAAEGMVFTVEPGIYLPGWGGVRIEDTVVVTSAGCEKLTAVPKELLVL